MTDFIVPEAGDDVPMMDAALQRDLHEVNRRLRVLNGDDLEPEPVVQLSVLERMKRAIARFV